jgi:uncharacterized protein (DUF427 family)
MGRPIRELHGELNTKYNNTDYVVSTNYSKFQFWYLRYYAEPKAAASNIKGRVAFWKGVQVSH